MLSHAPVRHSRVRVAQAGFTLVELMTVITIVGVLLSIGVPSYRYVTNNNRVSAEINSLVGDLQYARAQAITEGQTVTTCISTDGSTCAASATPNAWNVGWIVVSNSSGTVRRVQKAFSGSDAMTSTNPTSATSITFNREGYATGIPNGVVITLHDSKSNPKYTRCLNVNLIGQLSVVTNGATLLNSGTCS